MPLTNNAVKQAKPQDKNFKLSDVAVGAPADFPSRQPNGGKYWRLKYRYAGKEKRLALGLYPETVRARELATKAKQPLHNGGARLRALKPGNSFEAVGLEWFSNQKPIWSDIHAKKTL